MSFVRLLLAVVLLVAPVYGHIGSPDVFYEGAAGPYRLLVTIRPPAVIPGVAEIEIRDPEGGIRDLRIVPLPLTGAGTKFAPTPDVAQRSKQDPHFFTAALWLMGVGSWQVRIHADGDKGAGEMSVPVPTLPARTRGMQMGMGALLSVLALVLAIGIVSIVGAGVRDGPVEPGQEASPSRRRRARIIMSGTSVFVALFLYLGYQWWGLEANNYARIIYKPMQVSASMEPNGRLILRMRDPGWLRRKMDDLIPDHTHLMHMFLIGVPGMDRFWHLHPDRIEAGVFAQDLPAAPAGRYQIFADIVHETGIPETLATEVDLPEVAGRPLSGDDSGGAVPQFPDGGRMVWLRDGSPLRAKQLTEFRFQIEDKSGRPAEDLELYMGMQGHAAFVRTDRSVFAHVHPSGSVPMAALSLTANPHAGHAMHSGLPSVVSFPYGFPNAGDYRIFVQIKRGGVVQTGVFDTTAE